jgi:hypothetical protein
MTPLRHSISGGQEKGAARRDAGGPGGDDVPQRLLDLVAAQQPDVLDVLDDAVLDQDGCDFAHLVPEHRVEPVLDVEQVVLDVGEHRLGAAEQLVELLAVLGFIRSCRGTRR